VARRACRLLFCAVLAALLAVPAAASAHATLEGSAPQRGATVKDQPGAVVLRFSEPVEGNFGAIRVYDAEGAQVDAGEAFHPGGEGSRLGVRLGPDLPAGSYTATYRVVSADGHIVSGGYVFSIGAAGRAPEETVAELVADRGADAVAEIGLGVARGVQYAALALALGALAFWLLVWGPARRPPAGTGQRWEAASRGFDRRLRALLLLAAVAGAASAAAGVVFHAAEAAGVAAASALDATILREELGTRFGTVWALTALAWLGFGILLAASRRPLSPRWALVLLAPLGFVALEPALSGHPSTQSPVALLLPANVAHVLAASVWLGGLAALLFVLPAATRELEPAGRSRLLAAALVRFSPVALLCVAVILLTGIGQGYAYVRELENLLDTAYGRAVLIKLALLIGLLIPLAAYNRRRSVPGLERIAAGGEPPGRAGVLLRRALRGEVALAVVILGVTAALAGYAPATAVQSGPFSGGAALGPAELEVTVDPARVGSNQVHLYLFDARSGAQFDRVKELELTASEPEKQIGPLALDARRAGPGHYTVQGAIFGVAGDWQLETTLRVSAFDQYTAELEIPIR
jgi:copper transport protein